MWQKRVVSGRMTANLDGGFVVLLIGMRMNKPWKIHKWLPVFTAMPRLLRTLSEEDLGMLGYHVALRPTGPAVIDVLASTWSLPSRIAARPASVITSMTRSTRSMPAARPALAPLMTKKLGALRRHSAGHKKISRRRP